MKADNWDAYTTRDEDRGLEAAERAVSTLNDLDFKDILQQAVNRAYEEGFKAGYEKAQEEAE